MALHTAAVFTENIKTLCQNNSVFTNCISVDCEYLKRAYERIIIFITKNSNYALYSRGRNYLGGGGVNLGGVLSAKILPGGGNLLPPP